MSGDISFWNSTSVEMDDESPPSYVIIRWPNGMIRRRERQAKFSALIMKQMKAKLRKLRARGLEGYTLCRGTLNLDFTFEYDLRWKEGTDESIAKVARSYFAINQEKPRNAKCYISRGGTSPFEQVSNTARLIHPGL